jgi:pimeloyl-ACP methyl ester carboxylesterase
MTGALRAALVFACVVSASLSVAGCASYPSTGPDMKFVDAAGVQTHVESWGTGEPILLIHGASSHIGTWQPTIVPMLRERFHVVAYDRPGMGFTEERPQDADTLAVQARVAASVIEQSGLNKPIVVAHSWGGAVALRLALDRPDLVGGLVLIAPVAYEWPGGVSWHLYWSSNPLVGGLFNNVLAQPFAGNAVKQGMAESFTPNEPPAGWLEAAEVSLAARPGALRANGEDMVAAKREVTAQQARYSDIKVPVGILVGDGDKVVSPTIHSLRLAEVLPNARIDVLRGVGHLPQEIAPDRFRKLLDWVAATKAGRSS